MKGRRRIASGFWAMSSTGRALDSEQDQIRGLEVGADDYVSKTASEAMLLVRVKKALERAGRFSRIEAPTEMAKIQADIYRLLGSERGRFFSYVEIYEALCGEGYYHDEGAIRVHISRLRAKLPRGEKIEAKRGRGYALTKGAHMKKNEIVVYQPDGITRVDVRFDGETVWLLQSQMAELFACSLANVRLHLKNIYASGELGKEATSKESLEVRYSMLLKSQD